MKGNLSAQLAAQFKEVFIDGTWIATNYQSQLEDVEYKDAFSKIGDHNTIAMLTYHIHYYLKGVLDAMRSGKLTIRDKYSFDIPPDMNAVEWDKLKLRFNHTAKDMYELILNMGDEEILGPFIEEKYGNNYRNIHGLIEHGYYHLGQLVLIKKLIRTKKASE